jgi:hypothetical protein
MPAAANAAPMAKAAVKYAIGNQSGRIRGFVLSARCTYRLPQGVTLCHAKPAVPCPIGKAVMEEYVLPSGTVEGTSPMNEMKE